MAQTRPKIIVIGNAPRHKRWLRWLKVPLKNHNDFVNNRCHTVVRFNQCSNYNQGTGTKTNILALINNGSSAQKFLKHDSIPKAVVEQIDCVWFTRPANQNHDFLIDNNAAQPIDYSTEIIDFQGFKSKKIAYIDGEIYQHLYQKIIAQSPLHHEPSSGIAIIENILRTPDYEHFDKYLLGFSWQGWQGHHWETEKKICLAYEKQKRLTILR